MRLSEKNSSRAHNQIEKQKWKSRQHQAASTNYDESCCLCHMTTAYSVSKLLPFLDCGTQLGCTCPWSNVCIWNSLLTSFVNNNNDFRILFLCDLIRIPFTTKQLPFSLKSDKKQHAEINLVALFRIHIKPIKTTSNWFWGLICVMAPCTQLSSISNCVHYIRRFHRILWINNYSFLVFLFRSNGWSELQLIK